jgi:hypothetical protein
LLLWLFPAMLTLVAITVTVTFAAAKLSWSLGVTAERGAWAQGGRV